MREFLDFTAAFSRQLGTRLWTLEDNLKTGGQKEEKRLFKWWYWKFQSASTSSSSAHTVDDLDDAKENKDSLWLLTGTILDTNVTKCHKLKEKRWWKRRFFWRFHPTELARLAAQAAIGSVDVGVFSSLAAKPHQTDLDIQGRHTPPISSNTTESTSSSSGQIGDTVSRWWRKSYFDERTAFFLILWPNVFFLFTTVRSVTTRVEYLSCIISFFLIRLECMHSLRTYVHNLK